MPSAAGDIIAGAGEFRLEDWKVCHSPRDVTVVSACPPARDACSPSLHISSTETQRTRDELRQELEDYKKALNSGVCLTLSRSALSDALAKLLSYCWRGGTAAPLMRAHLLLWTERLACLCTCSSHHGCDAAPALRFALVYAPHTPSPTHAHTQCMSGKTTLGHCCRLGRSSGGSWRG